jgi:hypothetical protein
MPDHYVFMFQVLPVQGIRYNAPLLSQCSVCVDVPYSHPTTSTEIESCKSQGNFIAVAARQGDASTLSVVAGTYSSELTQTSSSSTAAGPQNGAYWYYIPGQSFGFAGTSQILLNSADTMAIYEDCQDRLSWHLDGAGGWNAGCNTYLNSDTIWRKLIYSCNVNVRAV